MKKIIAICTLLICIATTHAQNIETFDSNKYGWIETVKKNGSAIITEGVMRLECNVTLADLINQTPLSERTMQTSCYAPFDPKQNFTFKCTAIAKKVNTNGSFGLIFNYMDDYNYSAFYIGRLPLQKNAVVIYQRVVDNEIVGQRISDLKLNSKKNVEFKFELRSMFDRLEFYGNEMKIMEVRYNPIEYSGIGFGVYGEQTVDFDNVEFIQ